MPAPSRSKIDDADLTLLRAAAENAGKIALSYMERPEVRAWDKTPGHPVTEADLAVNAYLQDALTLARPEYGWLSEETADTDDRLSRTRVFVVDPIDGTRAFIAGQPYWCVGLAVIEDGMPLVAVIHAPVLGETYDAVLGGGARLNGTRLSASAQDKETDARLIASKGLIKHPDWPAPWPKVQLVAPIPNATLYRMALVAKGDADGTLSLAAKYDWDLAAGALLVAEAGGRVTTHAGEPFVFNRTVPAQRSLVAAGKDLHPLLIERTKRVRLADPQAAAQQNESEEGTAMAEAPAPQKQLLHIVIGGVLKDVSDVEFDDLSKIDFVGAYPNYAMAYDAWKSAAQRTVDNAEMRYFILHAHKLLDPETGVHHHA
ncbi:MAG: inositol monophosphatase family protein [Pseudomonadota bacterium]